MIIMIFHLIAKMSLIRSLRALDQSFHIFSNFFSKDLIKHIAHQIVIHSVLTRPEKPCNIIEYIIEKFNAWALNVSIV